MADLVLKGEHQRKLHEEVVELLARLGECEDYGANGTLETRPESSVGNLTLKRCGELADELKKYKVVP